MTSLMLSGCGQTPPESTVDQAPAAAGAAQETTDNAAIESEPALESMPSSGQLNDGTGMGGGSVQPSSAPLAMEAPSSVSSQAAKAESDIAAPKEAAAMPQLPLPAESTIAADLLEKQQMPSPASDAPNSELSGKDASIGGMPGSQALKGLAQNRSIGLQGRAVPGIPELRNAAPADGMRANRFSNPLPPSPNGLFRFTPEQQKLVPLDLQPGEELWIIAKPPVAEPAEADSNRPGCGALMATLPQATKQVPVPLRHTAVRGKIDGYIATVDVTQQFHNPYDSKIEAVYTFPLPQNAAVNEFVMTIGDRRIRGIIREREKAEQIYASAKSQGHVASLMTQERPNIFTQKVANIEPGKQIDINIRYFNTLQYDDGAYEFVFPMVVGPRYNPPASTDGVGAVARGQHATSGQKTEVQYLAPHERSGHDVSLSLNIAAGVDIEAVDSVNHIVDVKETSECERAITLSAADTIPNKDFVLRYKVAGSQIKTAMLTHQDKHGSYFTMMLYPPADLGQVQRSPMEMVFVLDCSGSMKGKPLTQAKDAISHALQSLTERDTFQIIQFSSNASQLGAEPVLATEENIKRGLKYLASLNGGGGTQMIEGIKAALDFPHDEGRFRLVSFMTDGFIGNEQQILGTLHDKLGASRVFSFGVGSSPNRYVMDRMAVLGRGAVAYLSLNDDAVQIMDRFNRRISHPAMTDLAIDWGQMEVADVYPQRLPDLIVGRPVVITGRYKGEPSTVKVNGRVNLQPASFEVALNEQDATKDHAGIAAVWARLKIKDMLNYATHAPEAAEEVRTTVTQTALAYNLMSSFTAFVAVDSMTKTEGEFGTTVAVPVPVPNGVKYETTVGAGN